MVVEVGFFSILLFNFVLFSPYYKFTSLEAHCHDEILIEMVKESENKIKTVVCAVVHQPVVGLANWCWSF